MAIRSAIVVLAVAALLAVHCVAALTLPVNVNNQVHDLVVQPGQSFIDAANKFCAAVGVDPTVNVARLVSAMEQESARQNAAAAAAAAPKPVVSLPLEVRGNVVNLDFYAGQDMVQVVNAFSAQYGLETADANLIYTALRDEVMLQQPSARIIASVDVDLDLGQGQTRAQPLQLRENQSIRAAVEAFASQHNVGAAFLPQLEEALRRQLAPEPVFTLPVLVDGSRQNLSIFEGERVDDAASSFCAKNGVLDEQCNIIRQAILSRLQRPAPVPATQPSTSTIDLTIGEQQFSMEFARGTTAEALAQHFCSRELNAVAAVLNQNVSMQDCVSVLASEIVRA